MVMVKCTQFIRNGERERHKVASVKYVFLRNEGRKESYTCNIGKVRVHKKQRKGELHM